MIQEVSKKGGEVVLSSRSLNKILAPRALSLIEQGICDGRFDARTLEYLKAFLPSLANRKRLGKLSRFCGRGLARRLLGLRRTDLKPSPAVCYEKIAAWSGDDGIIDLNGIRLMAPVTPNDETVFAMEFADVLLPSLIPGDSDDIICGLGGEGPYVYGEVRLNPGDVVIDAGANFGMFSAVAARAGCHVLAFEPSRHIADEYLRKNAELNGNIEIIPFAISDRPEVLRFIVVRDNIGASRRAEDMERIETDHQQEEEIQAVTLDDFVRERGLERVDFIKADIEGSERRMLLGAREVLERFAPKLSLCTYHLPDDPYVMRDIILKYQPRYRIVQREQKMYAWVP